MRTKHLLTTLTMAVLILAIILLTKINKIIEFMKSIKHTTSNYIEFTDTKK